MSASEAQPEPTDELVLLGNAISYVDLLDKLEDLEPISAIAQHLNVSESQLYNWSVRRDRNGFPQPAAQLGRFLLYDKIEVFAWHELWQKISKRMVAGRHLRNQKNGERGRNG